MNRNKKKTKGIPKKLQNQKGGCHCLSGKPQGVPRKLLRPGGLVQRRLYCPDGGTGTPSRAGAFASVLYRVALWLSRCADHTGGFRNHRLRKNRHQQLVQSGAHQVFPEKQRQPHSEGLFGGVLLLYLLSHHHPQITLAHPHPTRLFQLAENPQPAHSRR